MSIIKKSKMDERKDQRKQKQISKGLFEFKKLRLLYLITHDDKVMEEYTQLNFLLLNWLCAANKNIKSLNIEVEIIDKTTSIRVV